MRVAVALVVLALGVWALRSFAGRGGEREELRPEAAGPVASGVRPPDASAGLPPEDALPEIALEDQLAEDLLDVMLRTAGAGVPPDLRALALDLETILENQGLGRIEERELAARALASEIARRVTGGAPLGPRQQRRLARDYGVKLRLRFMARRDAAARHSGRAAPAPLEAEVPSGFEAVAWATLGGFPYVEGGTLPEAVRILDGKRVAVAGYMISLEGVRELRDFVLVESTWTCCFGLPPEIHQVIHATTPAGEPTAFTNYPVLVLGAFEAGERVEDGFVTSLYRIREARVVRLR